MNTDGDKNTDALTQSVERERQRLEMVKAENEEKLTKIFGRLVENPDDMVKQALGSGLYRIPIHRDFDNDCVLDLQNSDAVRTFREDMQKAGITVKSVVQYSDVDTGGTRMSWCSDPFIQHDLVISFKI